MPDPTPQKQSGQTVTVFAPDGSTGEIPVERTKDAIAAGGKLAVWVKAPNGDIGMIPHDRVPEAIGKGATLANAPEDANQAPAAVRFWGSALHALGLPANPEEYHQMAKAYADRTPTEQLKEGLANLPLSGPGVTPRSIAAAGKTFMRAGQESSAATDAILRGKFDEAMMHEIGGMGYTAAGLATPIGGQNLVTAGEQFGSGDVAGGMGTALPMVAPSLIHAAPEAAGAVRPYVGEGLARTGGVLLRNAEPIGKTVGYGGAALTAAEELAHGRPLGAGGAVLASPIAANRATRLASSAGGSLVDLGNKVGRTERPVYGPQSAPAGTGAEPATPPAVATDQSATVPGAASNLPIQPSGEMTLNRVLTSLDNKTLLKVARSRGIDVSAEANLKPGSANNRIISKIIDDFSDDELSEARDKGIQNFSQKPVQGELTPEQGKDLWTYKVLQTFFPDAKMPLALEARARFAMARRPQSSVSAMPASAQTAQPTTPIAPEIVNNASNLEELLRRSLRRK